MFLTEHLEGRLRYETDKVVCIDVYARKDLRLINLDFKEGDFVTQVLLSLITKQHHLTLSAELYLNKAFAIQNHIDGQEALFKELFEGLDSYLKVRKNLGLD